MDIIITRKGECQTYGQLKQGDTFILPKGGTVYMKLPSEPHFSNCPERHPAVNLANGNVYGGFRHKDVVKVNCKLIATIEEK